MSALPDPNYRPVAHARPFTRGDMARVLDNMSDDELMMLGWKGPLSFENAERRRKAMAKLKREGIKRKGANP